MSVVRRVPRLIFVCVSALWLATCAARPTVEPNPGPNPLMVNPCEKGAPSLDKQAPVVCIDDSARTLVAKPDRIVIHESKKGAPSEAVAIQWYTTSGTGDLHVKMDSACDALVDKGHGTGKYEMKTVPGKKRQCKYDVWITGPDHDRLDPTVVVDACCS